MEFLTTEAKDLMLKEEVVKAMGATAQVLKKRVNQKEDEWKAAKKELEATYERVLTSNERVEAANELTEARVMEVEKGMKELLSDRDACKQLKKDLDHAVKEEQRAEKRFEDERAKLKVGQAEVEQLNGEMEKNLAERKGLALLKQEQEKRKSEGRSVSPA